MLPAEQKSARKQAARAAATASKVAKEAAKAAAAAASSDHGDDVVDDDDDDDDDQSSRPALEVKQSTIPGAGQGLFLASRRVAAGSVLLEEDAIPIKRPEAKKLMNSPEWKDAEIGHPVIQLSSDRFLSISHLLLYKSNHCDSASPKCNAYCSKIGAATLRLTARRDVWRGEEILWEYTPTIQF